MTAIDAEVARYWTHGSLERAIRDGLHAGGCDLDRVRPDDLTAVDEFHMGGREATVCLAERMGLKPGMTVLDLGCGIGGPARFIARHYGCTVVGIDLTPEYVAVAEMLTRLVGLADRVTFQVGSATDLPFEPSCFDAATLLHVGMNIPDKQTLCDAAARVLKPRGVFAIYDVMRVGEGDLAFPVVWAATPALSFLEKPGSYRAALESAGFEVIAETSRWELALSFFARMKAHFSEHGPPPLGLHVLMGPDARQKIANTIASLERGILAPIEMICRRRH